MALASTSARRRVFSFALAETLRATSYRLRASPFYWLRYSSRIPDRLLIAPTDLRTADGTCASDIYVGRFILAGKLVETGRNSVFSVPAPNEEWLRELNEFSWLRHLRASDMTRAREKSRALIDEWLQFSGRSGIAFEPEVIAKRVIAWLSQSPMILDGCDYPFYQRFIQSLTRQVHRLRRVASLAPAGMPRMRTAIALVSAALAMAGRERFIRQAARWLDNQLAIQVLPDGGHVSRNPGAVLELLADLLPVRQAFTARGIPPSRALTAAIDRMMPMLGFFRHGDGSFARFNGMDEMPSDLVATVLAYDESRSMAPQSAPQSGYQRLTGGSTLVLVDVGKPPAIAVSAKAHAGCLAFEMSIGEQHLIVNCGHPGSNERLRRFARTTPAHSTVALNDTSSCRFLTEPPLSERLGEVVTSGPSNVALERADSEDATTLLARHDGYVERYGIIHERRLKLSASGDRLEGNDSFLTPAGNPLGRTGKDSFAIRFHLHPTVDATRMEGGRTIELSLPDGEVWAFDVALGEAIIEESVFFSAVRGNLASSQIVVYGRPQASPATAWRLRRLAGGGRRL